MKRIHGDFMAKYNKLTIQPSAWSIQDRSFNIEISSKILFSTQFNKCTFFPVFEKAYLANIRQRRLYLGSLKWSSKVNMTLELQNKYKDLV